MPKEIEGYPLIDHLKNQPEVFTAGVIVCVVNVVSDFLPKYLVEYLNSPKKRKRKFKKEKIEQCLDQVKVWIITEKSIKPNEHDELSTNLTTPPQETRKPDEYLCRTLMATLIEECLSSAQIKSTLVDTFFSYCQGISYLGHSTYQHPAYTTEQNQYRADYFLVAYSGDSPTFQPNDKEIDSGKWVAISEYLDESNFSRRLGGKVAVKRGRKKLLLFLETYWQNRTGYQLSLTEAVKNTESRKNAPDFIKQRPSLTTFESS